MAISTFSILEAVSSASLPGDPYIRSGHDSREASCESTVIPQASCYHAGTKIMTIETEEVCENIFSYTNKNIQSNSLFSRDPVFNTSNHMFLSFQCHMYETRDYDDLSLRSSMKEPVDMSFTRPELGVQHVEFSSFLTVRHTTTCPTGELRDGKDLIRPSYDDTGICPTHAKLSSQYSLIHSQTLRISHFFLRIFDEFFSGFRAKFQKIVTCVAFSIKFAKTN